MNSHSRQLTGQTGSAIPVIAHGLVRSWGKIDDTYTISPLVVNTGEGQVNGVLLEIDDAALVEFDRRESGYQRLKQADLGVCHRATSSTLREKPDCSKLC